MESLFDLFVSIGVDSSGVEKGIGDTKEKVKCLGEEFDGTGKKSSTFGDVLKANIISDAVIGGIKTGVSALLDFGRSALESGMSFDSSMSQVAATMGKTRDEITAIEDKAKELGANTAFTATQAADGFNYLALAGYSAEQAIATIPSVLNLAQAGGMELAQASDMVTDAMSALGLEADEEGKNVTRFGDILAKTASSSNTSVAQLGDAILTVGGTAKDMAGGTEELAATLGILADNGIKASEGGTHLRNILLSMTPATSAAEGAWAALGVSGYNADGSLRPLKDTFLDISKAMDGMSDAEKTNMLSKMFNKTDLSAINALMATSEERFVGLEAAVTDSNGAMAEMAETMMDNLPGALTIFGSAVDGAKLALFDAISGIATDGVKFATDAISTLTVAFQEGGISGMADAATGIATGFLDSLTEKLSGDSTHTVAAALATVTNFTSGLRENFGKIVDSGVKMLESLAQGVADNMPNFIAYFPTIISNVAGIINDNSPKILAAGVKIIVTLGEGVIKSIPTFIQNFPKIVKAAADVFTAFNWLELGANIVKGIASGVTGAAGQLFESIKGLAKNALGAAKDALGIHSPSRVFRDVIGRQIPAGFAQGVDDGETLVSRAVKQLSESAVDSAGRLDVPVSISPQISSPLVSAEPLEIRAAAVSDWVSVRSDADVLTQLLRQVLELLETYLPEPRDVVLDSGELVGTLGRRIDERQGRLARWAKRGV